MSAQHVRLTANAGTAPAHATHGHARHRPEDTVLYQVIEEHWRAFVERADEHGGLPRFTCRLRRIGGYDRALCADVVRAFTEEVSRSLRRRAKDELGLESLSDAHAGSVAFVQRFDSALRPAVAVRCAGSRWPRPRRRSRERWQTTGLERGHRRAGTVGPSGSSRSGLGELTR